ncbi:MAG TPA: patatin-like phospholipase family protein [Azospirillum sp.]
MEDIADSMSMRGSPVNTRGGDGPLKESAGLCLSGGGYRAMLFHAGVLWRLYEVDRLKTLARVSSVSGGSITAGMLALRWRRLSFVPANVRTDFEALVVAPLRELASRTLDANAVIGGIFLPGTIAEHIARNYDDALYGGATLQDLPDDLAPRFVINATNVQTGSLWRFSRPYMGDWQVGRVLNPTLALSTAVAASSAFPPVLSPLVLNIDPSTVQPDPEAPLRRKPYTSRVVLTDGGVYDNLGLETVWKRYETVFVSDGGQKMAPEPEPHEDWARHSLRIFSLTDNQVRALRKRQVVGSFRDKTRKGAYWGIRSLATDFPAATPLACPGQRTQELAAVPTRLARMDDRLQERLINWGYAVCDLALRSYHEPDLPAPGGFPYPESGV